MPHVRITQWRAQGAAGSDGRSRSATAWGGVDHPGAEIHDVIARDDAGQLLPIDHAAGAATWIVHHARGEHVTLSYAVVAQQAVEPSTNHRPVVRVTGLVHLIGVTVLAYPGPLADGAHRVRVRVAQVRGGRLAGRARRMAPSRRSTRALEISDFREAVFVAAPDPARGAAAGAGQQARGRARQQVPASPTTRSADLAAKVIVAQRNGRATRARRAS